MRQDEDDTRQVQQLSLAWQKATTVSGSLCCFTLDSQPSPSIGRPAARQLFDREGYDSGRGPSFGAIRGLDDSFEAR